MNIFEGDMNQCDCCDNTIHLWVYIIILSLITSAICWRGTRRFCKSVREMPDPEIVSVMRH